MLIKKVEGMTTGNAIQLVSGFGAKHMLGFLETIEVLDTLVKLPDYARKYVISDEMVKAYYITIGEMEVFCGQSGE